MIYIIVHKTSENFGSCTLSDKEIVFTSTNKDAAKKVLDDYKELIPNSDYNYEVCVLYEYPEMDTINYPSQEIETIIDIVSYE